MLTGRRPRERRGRANDDAHTAGPRPASPRNPQILQLRKWTQRPERARRDGVVVGDGRHPAEEALAAGMKPVLVVTSPHVEDHPGAEKLRAALEAHAGRALRITTHLMDRLSADPSPQGLLTVWKRPPVATVPPAPDVRHRAVLGLVGIQDPGNVGSLLRSAAAFGVHHALVFDETVDPYHPKVLRASAGLAFRLTFSDAAGPPAKALREMSGKGWSLVALDPSAGKTLHPRKASGPWVLLLGNEGHGLPKAVLEMSHRVRIPIAPSVESLGVAVAGALALYALSARGAPQRGASRP